MGIRRQICSGKTCGVHGRKWEGRGTGSECVALPVQQGAGCVQGFGLPLSQVPTYRESFLVERSCTCSWKAKCNVIISSRVAFFFPVC